LNAPGTTTSPCASTLPYTLARPLNDPSAVSALVANGTTILPFAKDPGCLPMVFMSFSLSPISIANAVCSSARSWFRFFPVRS
jgi:hypothetical protein